MHDPLASLNERRERYRIALSGTVWGVDARGEPFEGVLSDLSATGLSCVSGTAPLPGTQLTVYVQLHPADSVPIVGEAVVVHAALRADGRYDIRCRSALPLQ
ncbi:MAG: PilZ domain-containing protein [Pseudomonadota bacterium]